MPKLIPQQYAKLLYGLTKGLEGKKLDSAVRVFADYLKKEQSLSKVDYILKHFESYAKEKEGITQISITGARKLSTESVDEIKKSFGKNVETVTGTDKSLIGGVIVRTKNTILDGSIRTQLQNLKRKMSK